jgi:hypothetical protein
LQLTIIAQPELNALLANGPRTQIERDVLLNYIRARWFGWKARTVRDVRASEQIQDLMRKTVPFFGCVTTTTVR